MDPSPLPDLPDVPAELAVAGAEGHLVVLVGAGASFGAGLPSWDGLLSDLLEVAIREAREPARREELEAVRAEWAGGGGGWDALTKASLLGQRLGEQRLREAIAERMRVPGASPTATHRALAALLPGAAFVTTNYDQLLEAAIEARTGRRPKGVLLDDMEGLRDLGAGQVLKLHGDLDAPERIVLRGEDYFDVGHRAPRAWKERLKALLQPPWRVLIVGYGYGDIDVQEVVNELRGAYEARLGGPFWLEVAGLRQAAKATANGLRLIGLRGYGEVVPWLERLGEAIARRRREAPVMQMALALAGEVLAGFEEKNKEAARRFEEHDFEGALTMYQEMLTAAERLRGSAGEDEEHRRRLSAWATRCRLNVGACFACLQRTDEALAVLRKVADEEIRWLSPVQRLILAEGLAQVGDPPRAGEVLPREDELSTGDERTRRVEIRQLIEILEGRIPSDLVDSPVVLLHAARRHAAEGDLEQAARTAERALDRAQGDPLAISSVLNILVRSLLASIWEQVGIPRLVARPLGWLVQRIEEGFRRLDALRLPSAVLAGMERLRARYDLTIEDEDRREEAVARLGKEAFLSEAGEAVAALEHEIKALALEGRTEEALQRLPATSDHPWIRGYNEVAVLANARRPDEAIEKARALAEAWPERAPIHFITARLLFRADRAEDALPHAEAGFETLPGRGYRLLLGQCQLGAGRAETAWSTLQPLEAGARSPNVLRALAIAAERAEPARAGGLWRRYLEADPGDAEARLHLAVVLFRAGDARGAADVAWDSFTGPGNEKLGARALYDCAQLQLLRGELDEQAHARLKQLTDALLERFPADMEAKELRLRLLVSVDRGEEIAHSDWDDVAAAGRLDLVPLEHFKTILRDHMDRQRDALTLYRYGLLSFESLCALSQAHAASCLVRWSHWQPTTQTMLVSAPIGLAEPVPLPTLAGKHLLAGEIELLLLQKLGLLSRLRLELGPGGKLLLFKDVWDRILQSAADLALGTQPAEIQRLEDILQTQKHEQAPDDERERIERRLDELRQEVEAATLASALKDSLGAGIQEGWISPTLERPGVPDLPPPRPSDPALLTLTSARELLERTFAWSEAVVHASERWLLTADFANGNPLANGEILGRLAWKDRGAYHSLARRVRGVSPRTLLLPSLVLSLVPEKARRRRLLAALADLGFVDALRATDVPELVHGAQKPGRERITHRLARLEWVARTEEHRGCRMAQVRLAHGYSTAIWDAFRDGQRSEAEKQALTVALLQRAESIDEATTGNVLDLIFLYLAASTIDRIDAAYVPDEPGHLALSDESPAGRLWSYLRGWTGLAGRRRTAYGRGVREGWRLLDQRHPDRGPDRAQAMALSLSSDTSRTTPFGAPEVEAIAILSAGWEQSPLREVGVQFTVSDTKQARNILLEDLLRDGARHLEAEGISPRDTESIWYIPVYLNGKRPVGHVPAPPEAILLRATSEEAVARFARELAMRQGVHDGRAYAALEALRADPGDKQRRRDYARMTVAAPWRLVREDPAFLRTWCTRLVGIERSLTDLDDLRKMLSEPLVPLREDDSLSQMLVHRAEPGQAWAARADGHLLLRQACEVPGLLPATVLELRLGGAFGPYSAEVSAALRRLTQMHEQPAGRLVGDIFFLRAASVREPILRLPEGRQIDLREELPGHLDDVLQGVMSDPPQDTLGALEAVLLRVCYQAVHGLAAPATVPQKDGLWLTYRLFQWLVAQLDRLSPDARREGLAVLARNGPSAQEGEFDLLNPFRFDRDRFDHRVAAVLFAVGAMDEVSTVVAGSVSETGSILLRSASSAGLETRLMDLSARPLTDDERKLRRLGLTPSRLDWPRSGAIQELALTALLKLNRGRFADLPQEVQLRWIQALPLRAGDPDAVNDELAGHIVAALAQNAGRLSVEEHVAIEDHLQRMEASDDQRYMRWLLLTQLYGAGRRHLADTVRSLLLANLRHEVAPSGFSNYLAALSHQAPDRIEPEAEAILAAVKTEGLDPVPFAVGIGGAIFSGDRAGIPACQRLLRRLADEPPFATDERFLQLLHTLGLDRRR